MNGECHLVPVRLARRRPGNCAAPVCRRQKSIDSCHVDSSGSSKGGEGSGGERRSEGDGGAEEECDEEEVRGFVGEGGGVRFYR